MEIKKPLLSVVVPLYNEGAHLVRSLRVIVETLSRITPYYELIGVDDGSKDDTWQQLERAAEEIPGVIAIRLSRNFGKELAVCAGLENASGEAVIVMDGDLQHPPELIPEMVRLWQEEGYDIVECVKESRGKESLGKRLGVSVFYTTLDKLTGYNLKGASDFKLLDKKVLEAWMNMPERIPFFRGMTAWLGFRKVELPFHVADREVGMSRWGIFGLVRLGAEAIISFSTIPLRVVSLMGIGFFIVSLVLGINTLVQKFQGTAVTGFTTVILLLLIIGSILMISIGIVGEYIAAIYHEVKARPRYLIADKKNHPDLIEEDRELKHDHSLVTSASAH
ncbi:glycosyltransferase family 2 protein [Paenibacillus macquariensis]|uniref:Glycosyltransferase involved in cell wall bisynthesis n=1 Tax=Paenibacillus macquariensis TaxID=948756 RepID=A0ABY1K6Q3_9BACL|nr:glycosyltransferase family 2 protein [Paenibacillus macquariensis]MEC0093624.1 glycosyltransferase family 2 protein [Paenibacillus macquariensis]OAB35560.1 glycosyl transferase [Paenibacillus macquariensis subsp. macquariensis]SIR33574.1 Glycosyltransferase involved in cell wall bisynthesis [Paenibacillus macquariensis]